MWFKTYNAFSLPWWLNRGCAALQETREPGLLARAKLRLERVLALEPGNLLAMTLLGTIHMDLGKNIDAINAWNKVLAVGTWLGLVVLFFRALDTVICRWLTIVLSTWLLL